MDDLHSYSRTLTEAVECIVSEKVDLNAIKLAIEGLKGKMKDLGAKEKEMSRNLDINMNHFMNSMKNAMTNDRREAIIMHKNIKNSAYFN